MNSHPLLQELQQICSEHNVDIAKAQLTFDAYHELSEVKKLHDLKYYFNDELKLFYLTAKAEERDETPDAYVPILSSGKMSPQEMSQVQDAISPNGKRFNFLIRDRDLTTTCYSVTRGLIKPDSPETCRKKKELEEAKYNFQKAIYNNRRKIYSKALREQRMKEAVKKA